MLNKLGSSSFYIESYSCGFTEKATLPVIGNYMLHTASIHADERGFGFDSISKDNVAWVLSRFSIIMYEYPIPNQYIKIETWVEKVERYFTQRCFCVYDHEDKVIGYAKSIWAAINTETRRPINIHEWRPDLADCILDKECPIEKFEKILPVNGVEPGMGYSVRYSDIDINKHMNSIKYMQHIIDMFDLSVFREKMIQRFDIVYLAEGRYGDKLKQYRLDISEDACFVDTKRGEDSVCRCRIVWEKIK
jgi:acyl-ACP thioesterase